MVAVVVTPGDITPAQAAELRWRRTGRRMCEWPRGGNNLRLCFPREYVKLCKFILEGGDAA